MKVSQVLYVFFPFLLYFLCQSVSHLPGLFSFNIELVEKVGSPDCGERRYGSMLLKKTSLYDTSVTACLTQWYGAVVVFWFDLLTSSCTVCDFSLSPVTSSRLKCDTLSLFPPVTADDNVISVWPLSMWWRLFRLSNDTVSVLIWPGETLHTLFQ